MLPSDSSSSSSASRALTSNGRAMPSRLRSAMLAADAPALPASSLFAGGGLLSGRRSNLEEPHRGGGGGRAGAGGRAAAAAGRRAGIFSSASSASSVSSAPPQSPQRLVSLLSVSSATPQCLVSLLSASSASSARPRPWRRPRARLSPRASPSRGLRPRTAGSGSRARPRSRPQGSLAAPRPPCPGGSERRCARTGQQGGARGEAGARGRVTAARALGAGPPAATSRARWWDRLMFGLGAFSNPRLRRLKGGRKRGERKRSEVQLSLLVKTSNVLDP